MPVNKNMLLRMLILDELFRGNRKYTVEEMQERVSSFLEHRTGKEIHIGTRTIHDDIRFMREQFKAPVKVDEGRYFYEDKEYSIWRAYSLHTMEELTEAAELLKDHFDEFPFTDEIVNLVNRMMKITDMVDYKLFPYVVLETNPLYEGIKWIPEIYKAIDGNYKLHIDYDSFDGKWDFEDTVRPYFLKEFRNRWFLIGKPESVSEPFYTIPLDRIHAVKPLDDTVFFEKEEKDNAMRMFEEVVGATYIADNPLEEIILEFRAPATGYVRTKPIHHSQRIISETTDKLVISLKVRENYELYQSILFYVPNVRVVKPKHLHEKMLNMLKEGIRFMEE